MQGTQQNSYTMCTVPIKVHLNVTVYSTNQNLYSMCTVPIKLHIQCVQHTSKFIYNV